MANTFKNAGVAVTDSVTTIYTSSPMYLSGTTNYS